MENESSMIQTKKKKERLYRSACAKRKVLKSNLKENFARCILIYLGKII